MLPLVSRALVGLSLLARPRGSGPWVSGSTAVRFRSSALGWLVGCVALLCACAPAAAQARVYVRNTGDTDLHVARVHMPTGISWYSEGWFTVPPGKSRRLDDDGMNRPMYLGFAVVNDQGQAGAVHYQFRKSDVIEPTRRTFPVRAEAWAFPGFDNIDRPRDGFTNVPFSVYLDMWPGGSYDVTLEVEARANVEVIPFAGAEAAAAPQPAEPVDPAVAAAAAEAQKAEAARAAEFEKAVEEVAALSRRLSESFGEDLEAMYLLALHYRDGRGTATNLTTANNFFNHAAQHGHVPSMAAMGDAYADGVGFAKDPAQAVEWYRRAAEGGHEQSTFAMGVAYAIGRGVGADRDAAEAWAKRLILLGDGNLGVTMAVLYLNGGNVDGQVIPADPARGRRILAHGAANGVEPAAKMLETIDARPTTAPTTRPAD